MQNKRGQFYLIAAIIIVAIILGFATTSNSLKKEEFTEMDDIAKELEIESQAIIDHAVLNNLDVKVQLGLFAEAYAPYSEAENLYFIFGDKTSVDVGAYHKLYSGAILVNGQELIISQNQYTSGGPYTPIGDQINLTINELDHVFDLEEGTNFYFVIAKIEEEGNYFFARN